MCFQVSYSCEISFKQISGDDVYDFLVAFKEHAVTHIESIAKSNVYFSPILRNYAYNTPLEITREMKDATKNWMRNDIFRYRWFFDKEHQLLGIYSVQPELLGLFDCTVYFQNSTDQNYNYSDWNGVKYFEEIAAKWATADAETVNGFYGKSHHGDQIENLDDPARLDYHRKSNAYREIWDEFSHTLYCDNDVVYLTLFGAYDYDHISKFLTTIEREAKAEAENPSF